MKFKLIFALALILQLVAFPLQSLAAETDTSVAPINYLALGDSLAFGISSDGLPSKGYPDFLAQSLQEKNGLKSSNKGFSFPGYTATNVLNDMKENVAKPIIGIGHEEKSAELHKSIAEADLITISVGANDVLSYFKVDPTTGLPEVDFLGLVAAIQQVGVNYNMILKSIYAINPDVQVYVMGYYNPFPHLAPELQPQLAQMLVGMNGAIEAGMTGTSAVFVPTADAIATDFLAHLPNPQNIHLSEVGYKVVAAQFDKLIKENFKWIVEDAPTLEIPETPVPEVPTPETPQPEIPTPAIFTDIENHWAKGFIEKAVEAGMVSGYPDGTFKPEKELTRAQAASIIVRSLGLKADKAAPFKDISHYDDATQAEIAAAYQFGIVKGNNGQFNPNEPVTRAQLALMVKRAYEVVKQEPYIAKELAPYTDIANYDAETKNAIAMLHAFGIVDGMDGKFMPGNPTTRGQAAKIFVNYSVVMK